MYPYPRTASVVEAPAPIVGSPAGGPSAHRNGLTRRRVVAIAVAIGLVLVALFGALIFWGTGTAALPPTFVEARDAVNSTVAGVAGGGWTLLSGFGLDERAGSTILVTTIATGSSATCTPEAISGYALPTTLAVGAYSGSFGSGRAPFWLFLFRQTADGPFMIAIDTGASAVPVAYLNGSACATDLEKVAPMPDPIVNSPAVASASWTGSADASGFVAGDPAIDSLVMLATGSLTVDSVTFTGWGLEYSPCDPFLTNSTVSESNYLAGFTAAGTFEAAFSSHTDCPA
jgi:hypothetical protein